MVLVFSQIGQAHVIAFTASAVVVRDGRIVGYNTRRGMDRFARICVVNAKSTPMMLSGVITVLGIKVGCPLRPISIAVGTDNVDCVSDRRILLHSAIVLGETMSSLSIFRKLGKLNDEIHFVLLDKSNILFEISMRLDGVDLKNGHSNSLRLYFLV